MLRAVALALRARLRELLWLREIFLIAQPPLLVQGGEFAFLNIFPTLGNSIWPRPGIDCSSHRIITELFWTALVYDRPHFVSFQEKRALTERPYSRKHFFPDSMSFDPTANGVVRAASSKLIAANPAIRS